MIERIRKSLRSGKAGQTALKFATRSYVLTGVRLAQLGAVVALVPMEVFGASQMVGGILMVANAICLGGISTAVTQDAAKTRGVYFKRLVRLAERLLMVAGLIVIALAGWFYWSGRDWQFSLTLLWLGICLRGQSFQLLRDFWIGSGQINRAVTAELSLGILSAVASVTGALLFRDSVLAIALPPILISEWGWWCFRRSVEVSPEEPTEEGWRAERRYALARTGNGLIPALEIRADRAIVGSFLGFDALAIFALPRRIIDQLKALHSAARSVLLPRWTKGDPERSGTEFWLVVAIYFVVLSLGSLALFGAAIAVIEYVLPESYRASIPLLSWYLFGGLLAIPGGVLSVYATAKRQVKMETIYQTITSTIGLSLQVILLFQFGLMGMGYAFAVKSLLITVVTFIVCRDIVPGWSGSSRALGKTG